MRPWIGIFLAAVSCTDATAQSFPHCRLCTLGLYDDSTMTRTCGTIVPGEAKDLYLGISYAQGFRGLVGIEFSVSGIREDVDGISVLAVEPLYPAALVFGSAPAPADTSAASTGTGGMNIAWTHCVAYEAARRPLAKLCIRSASTVTDKILRVLPRYPPSARSFLGPLVISCDLCVWCGFFATGTTYTLNPTDQSECTVATEPATWGAVKALYRLDDQ